MSRKILIVRITIITITICILIDQVTIPQLVLSDLRISSKLISGFHLIWVTQPAFTTGYNSYQFIADDHYFYDPEKPTSPKTNLTATYPRLGNKNGVSSDFWEYSGNYLKLKNIQIGYTLPQYITRKVKIEKVRLYASADNLKTWTKFPGMDPEIGTSITYPLMKQCAFGLQLTF